jgi:hypothetical protein
VVGTPVGKPVVGSPVGGAVGKPVVGTPVSGAVVVEAPIPKKEEEAT